MSLNQKYTWQDFLKEYPEHKEKDTKRTSSDGKKAFETAYKANAKKYLAERMEIIDREIARATGRRKELVTKSKELRKAKKLIRVKKVDERIGKVDAAITRHQSLKERTKVRQKTFK